MFPPIANAHDEPTLHVGYAYSSCDIDLHPELTADQFHRRLTRFVDARAPDEVKRRGSNGYAQPVRQCSAAAKQLRIDVRDGPWPRRAASVPGLHRSRREGQMPGPATILEGLRAIANDAVTVAVVWHAVVAAAGVALLFAWRPSRPIAGALLSAPVATVSAFAFGYGNLFNGIAFGILALALFEVGTRMPAHPVQRGGAGMAAVGVFMIGVAWLYPHFLETRASAIYLVGAPMGLIPCPTL